MSSLLGWSWHYVMVWFIIVVEETSILFYFNQRDCMKAYLRQILRWFEGKRYFGVTTNLMTFRNGLKFRMNIASG